MRCINTTLFAFSAKTSRISIWNFSHLTLSSHKYGKNIHRLIFKFGDNNPGILVQSTSDKFDQVTRSFIQRNITFKSISVGYDIQCTKFLDNFSSQFAFRRSVSSEIVAESSECCRNHLNYTSCFMLPHDNDSFCFLVFVNGCSLFTVAVLINNSGRVVRLETCNV